MDEFEVVTLVLGGLLIFGALTAGLAHRSFLSMTAVFVVAGFVLGGGGLEVLEFGAERTRSGPTPRPVTRCSTWQRARPAAAA